MHAHGSVDTDQRSVAVTATGRPVPHGRHHPALASVLALQRSAGNAAVAARLTPRAGTVGQTGSVGLLDLQRCGPTPCECTDDERAAHATSEAEGSVQRQAAAPAAPAVPAPAPLDPNQCPDPAEQTRKETFRDRTDLRRLNHIPSNGLGKFDIAYTPRSSLLAVTVKLHFTFTDDASAPTGWDLLLRRLRGEDLSRAMWDDTQRRDYVTQFTSRVHSRWSGAHTIRSVKPCWVFNAVPDVNVVETANAANAHFRVTVHKSLGPGIDYRSAVNNEHLLDPTQQPTADFWQSDNREEPNFNSGAVATTERRRIQAAITSAGAGRILFEVDRDELTPAGATALAQLASALNAANPSAPLIPLIVEGFASADGDATHNTDLSARRARRVADTLAGSSIRQPVRHSGQGPVGVPRDRRNRAATVAADTTFETTYAANRYSVSEHEFGHMLGNPDEYANSTSGPLGTAQTKYVGLVTSAGLAAPTFGEDTSSQMSNGVDVLPRHYVTLWEALAQMTAPDLGQADWRIG